MFVHTASKHQQHNQNQLPVIKQGFLKKKSMGLNPFSSSEILYFFLKGPNLWGYKHQSGHGKPSSKYDVKNCIVVPIGSNQFKLLQKTGKKEKKERKERNKRKKQKKRKEINKKIQVFPLFSKQIVLKIEIYGLPQ